MFDDQSLARQELPVPGSFFVFEESSKKNEHPSNRHQASRIKKVKRAMRPGEDGSERQHVAESGLRTCWTT